MGVQLPGASAPAPELESKPTSQDEGKDQGRHVLYIDDDDSIVFLATRILERMHYRVTGCIDPRSALSDFRSSPESFDVVVTDLSMPGMSGFEVARALREIRSDIPILMTSGYVRPEDRALAQAHGILDLILKPNSVEEFGQALHGIFQNLAVTRN